MNRQNSPLYLRVGLGLGLATAAIGSTARAEPWQMPDLHLGAASANQAGGAELPVPAKFALARGPGVGTLAGRALAAPPAFQHPLSRIPARPPSAVPSARVSPPLSHPPASPLPASVAAAGSEPTPIYSEVDADYAAQSAAATPLYTETSEHQITAPAISTVEQVASEVPTAKQAAVRTDARDRARQGASHLDGWRVAGHSPSQPSHSAARNGTRAPRHLAAAY